MRLTRLLGAAAVLTAAILTVLMLAQPQIPKRIIDPIWENQFLQIPGFTDSWYNVSLHPSNKQDYEVKCSIKPMLDNVPPNLDLWVVNETGLSLLVEERRTGIAPAGFPPSAYALVWGIENGSERKLEFSGVDYDGYYFFYFVNYAAAQNISASLSESWTEMSPIVTSDPSYLTATSLLTVIGTYLLVRGLRASRRKLPSVRKKPRLIMPLPKRQ